MSSKYEMTITASGVVGRGTAEEEPPTTDADNGDTDQKEDPK